MPLFSSARAAIMFAWWGQFDCLIGNRMPEPDQLGATVAGGNIAAGLAAAINIKIWLERAAHKAGLESIDLILASELPQESPVNLQDWQQRRVDEAMEHFEDKLDRVGWLQKNSRQRENDLV